MLVFGQMHLGLGQSGVLHDAVAIICIDQRVFSAQDVGAAHGVFCAADVVAAQEQVDLFSDQCVIEAWLIRSQCSFLPLM